MPKRCSTKFYQYWQKKSKCTKNSYDKRDNNILRLEYYVVT